MKTKFTFLKEIKKLPMDDSKNPEYSTQARVISAVCKGLDWGIKSQTQTYRDNFAEWNMLKENNTGDESTATNIQRRVNTMAWIEKNLENMKEVQEQALEFYKDIVGKDFVPRTNVRVTNYSDQEIDSDYEPKQI